MKFKYAIVLALALAISAVLPVSASIPEQDPVALVETTAQSVLDALRKDPERTDKDPDFLFGLVEEIILPVVDFTGFSRLILGRHWRTAEPAQRDRFVNAFRNMLVRTYTLQMAEHKDKEIRVLRHRSIQDERMATVSTEILMGQGRPNLSVVYSLRPVDGAWKVFDLTVEGLSLVTNFRTNFGAEIDRNGLDALIERLEQGDESLIEDVVEASQG